MQITIAHYIASGDTGERFQLYVLESTNMGSFFLEDNQGHRMLFLDRNVDPGDKIIVHIGKGAYFSIEPEDLDDVQETIHVFYWDVDRRHWLIDSTTIVISDGLQSDSFTLDELLYQRPDMEE